MLLWLRSSKAFDGITLKRNSTMELLESGPGGVRAKRHGVEADAVEICDDFGPKGDVVDPVVVWRFNASAVGDEDDAGGMVTTGSEWEVGRNSCVVKKWRRGGGGGAATRRRSRRRRRHGTANGLHR